MHRDSSAHWCCMKPLCKIHSHFLQVSASRVVKVHDPVIPPLAHGEAHTITLLQTAPDSCCLLQLFSISPICQYELRSCAHGPIVAVKMIYYLQLVSYQITCRETVPIKHRACPKAARQWVRRKAGRRTIDFGGPYWSHNNFICIDYSDHCSA